MKNKLFVALLIVFLIGGFLIASNINFKKETILSNNFCDNGVKNSICKPKQLPVDFKEQIQKQIFNIGEIKYGLV